MPGKQLDADIGCLHKALEQGAGTVLDLDHVQELNRLTRVQDHVAMRVELVTCGRCIADDAHQSGVRHIVEGDRFQVVAQLGKAEGVTTDRVRSLEPASNEVHGLLGLLRCERDHPDVRLDLLALCGTGLIECQAPRVPDRKCRHYRLRPRSPFALGGADRRRQPGTEIRRIGHSTSPVLSRAIVCGEAA